MTRKRIATWMLLLLGLSAAALALPLLQERPPVLPPPPEDIPPFVLTRAFAAEHDATVLRLALNDRCRMDGEFLIAASPPKDRMDGRRELGLLVLPEDWACPSVRKEAHAKFRAELDRCSGQTVREQPHSPLPCLQQAYPGLTAWMSLEMPRYRRDAQGLSASVDFGIHCGPLCGSGWRSTLRLKNAVWCLVGTEPTWIS